MWIQLSNEQQTESVMVITLGYVTFGVPFWSKWLMPHKSVCTFPASESVGLCLTVSVGWVPEPAIQCSGHLLAQLFLSFSVWTVCNTMPVLHLLPLYDSFSPCCRDCPEHLLPICCPTWSGNLSEVQTRARSINRPALHSLATREHWRVDFSTVKSCSVRILVTILKLSCGTLTHKWTSVTFKPSPNKFAQCLCISQYSWVFKSGVCGDIPVLGYR